MPYKDPVKRKEYHKQYSIKYRAKHKRPRKPHIYKPLSEETKKKLSDALRGERHPFYGKKFSETHRKNLSESHKGQVAWNKGKCLSEKIRTTLSSVCRLKGEKSSHWKGGKIKTFCKQCKKDIYVHPSALKQGRGKFCSRRCLGIWNINHTKFYNTDIERLIEDELIKRKIPYTKQVPLFGIALVDFLLPKDIVIQCDGEYWHSTRSAKERDLNQDFVLTFYGYRIFRFTGNEIKKSAKKCMNKIPLLCKEIL